MSNTEKTTLRSGNQIGWTLEVQDREVHQILMRLKAAQRFLPGPLSVDISKLVEVIPDDDYFDYAPHDGDMWLSTMNNGGEITCVDTYGQLGDVCCSYWLHAVQNKPSPDDVKELLSGLLDTFTREMFEHIAFTPERASMCNAVDVLQAMIDSISADLLSK